MRMRGFALAAGIGALVLVSACSSGGSGDATPSSTSPAVSPTPTASLTPAQFYAGFQSGADTVIANANSQSTPPKSSEIQTQVTAVEDLVKYIATSTVPEDANELIDNVEQNASLYLKTAQDLSNESLELESIEKQEQAAQSLIDAQTQLINAIDNVCNSQQFRAATS